MISVDLNRNVEELKSLRNESKLRTNRMEMKIKENFEELNALSLQNGKFKEVNNLLNTKLEAMTRDILDLNDNFKISIEKYQNEIDSKEKIIELYKEKSLETTEVQSEISKVISEMKKSMEEVVDQNLKLEAKFLNNEMKFKEKEQDFIEKSKKMSQESQELAKITQTLQNELQDIKNILQVLPNTSNMTTPEILIKLLQDFTIKSQENQNLKLKIQEISHEVIKKAKNVQNQLDFYENENQCLSQEFDNLKSERFDVQMKIENFLLEISSLKLKIKNGENRNEILSQQNRKLLEVIENKKDGSKRSEANYIQELQDNNLQLLELINEMKSEILELRGSRKRKSDEKLEKLRMKIVKTENRESSEEITDKI
jgi:hypothetical protein